MKNLLLLATLLLSNVFYAQFPVWINSFDTPADLEGWTIHDLNTNGNAWLQGQNIYHNGTTLAYGADGVLRHSISNVPSGNVTGFATENDWIISPEIDLTSASGTITLAAYIGRQRLTHTSLGRFLYIYESTPGNEVPELAGFQAMAVDAEGTQIAYPYKIVAGEGGNPFTTDLTQFVESLVDISAFAGKKIYIGLWSNRITTGPTGGVNVQNININEIGIYATEILGSHNVEKEVTTTQIIQNPATTELLLQLNPAIKNNAASLHIYNIMGQHVLTAPYSSRTDVNLLSAGTYFLQITNGETVERLKFIKK